MYFLPFFGISLCQNNIFYSSLDPASVRAREGMERVEKHNEMGVEGGYDVEVEDMAASDNEVTVINWKTMYTFIFDEFG